jgi:DNA-binding response OmpR family regulator
MCSSGDAPNDLEPDVKIRKSKEMEPIRVLVVDDELFVGELLKEYLSIIGYAVTAVSNGEEALSVIQRFEPHIVILDIRMPGMSGMEVLKNIKEKKGTTAVIMLSAYGDPETVNEALRLGADHYLQKPMNLKHLVETLTSLHPSGEK